MTLTLAGFQYHVDSPSLFRQVGYPVRIRYDGRAWLVAVRDVWGTRELASRDEAAAIIAQAFRQAQAC